MRSATKTNVFITSDSEVLRDGVAVVDVCLHVCSRQYVGITSERFAGGHDFRACQGDVFNSSLYQNKGARLATLIQINSKKHEVMTSTHDMTIFCR